MPLLNKYINNIHFFPSWPLTCYATFHVNFWLILGVFGSIELAFQSGIGSGATVPAILEHWHHPNKKTLLAHSTQLIHRSSGVQFIFSPPESLSPSKREKPPLKVSIHGKLSSGALHLFSKSFPLQSRLHIITSTLSLSLSG